MRKSRHQFNVVLVVSVPAKNRSITVLFMLNPRNSNAIFCPKVIPCKSNPLTYYLFDSIFVGESRQPGKHGFDS